jgi:hypothetical protein
LDNVFQNFCSDFADFIFDRDPIQAVRRRLEYRFYDQVTNFFNGIRNGVVPSILLPQSLTKKAQGSTKENGGSGGAIIKTKTQKTKGKPDLNPEAKEEWCVPAGKKFGDYFSPASKDLKLNCSGWPSFPHQTTKTDRPMCVRFQTTGGCTTNCANAHTLPSKMDPKVWGEVKARLKEILGL